jgi:two-component system cell cycle sensor histidine kinase PleC
MYLYIRWFSGIAFILVALSALVFGYYAREAVSGDVVAITENSNESLARGFINTLWKESRIKSALRQHKKLTENEETNAALYDLSNRLYQYFKGIPVAEVSIYSTDGLKLAQIDPADSKSRLAASMHLQHIPSGDKAFATSLTGAVASDLLQNDAVPDPEGSVAKGMMTRTLIPIIENNNLVPALNQSNQYEKANIACTATNIINCVEGVMEIRYHVPAELWRHLNLFQQLVIPGILLLTAAFVFLLFFTAKKAEAMIVKQYETNIELTAQIVNAQAENRDKSQFLANVSHELRTPLNAIIGFAEFINLERSGTFTNRKYAEYIKDIHGSGVRLLGLINDILDYSKAEAGKLEFYVSEVDVTRTLKSSIKHLSPRAETGKIQLIENIPSNHFTIKTDGKRLRQIMLNLLSNAVKFTPSGGSVTVAIWENKADGSISMEIRDTGIGIAPKDIPRAMTPFGQVDSTLARKYEGTGLGLPLTRKFIRIMGGSFNIQSEVGKGTTILISLPRESKGKDGTSGEGRPN